MRNKGAMLSNIRASPRNLMMTQAVHLSQRENVGLKNASMGLFILPHQHTTAASSIQREATLYASQTTESSAVTTNQLMMSIQGLKGLLQNTTELKGISKILPATLSQKLTSPQHKGGSLIHSTRRQHQHYSDMKYQLDELRNNIQSKSSLPSNGVIGYSVPSTQHLRYNL